MTDSQGAIAFYELGLINQQVFFDIASDGYEFPKEGFRYRGTKVTTNPGTTVTLKIHPVNVAVRLGRELCPNSYKRKDLKLGCVWRKQLLTIS